MTTSAATTPTAATLPTVALTHADRCDRCGAQAFVRVSIFNAAGLRSELMFCAHHYRVHQEPLLHKAIAVQDDTGSINVKPSASAV